MNIPEDTNTRAEDMWRVISQKVDFRGKRVIDLGCGTGDFLWRAGVAGAHWVHGIDEDLSQLEGRITYGSSCRAELADDPPASLRTYSVTYTEHDINQFVEHDWVQFATCKNYFDIAMCFSVLPYLDNIPATLKWMSDNFPLCLIEAQYEPEPYNIGVPSDDQMYVLLRDNGFKCATWLGQTYVEDRDTHRSIWACSKKMLRL